MGSLQWGEYLLQGYFTAIFLSVFFFRKVNLVKKNILAVCINKSVSIQNMLDKMNWYEAENACNKVGAHLASLNSEEENQFAYGNS